MLFKVMSDMNYDHNSYEKKKIIIIVLDLIICLFNLSRLEWMGCVIVSKIVAPCA